MIPRFKEYLKQHRTMWRAASRNAELYRRFPSLRIADPISWKIDDYAAVDFGADVNIGPFTEIFILAKCEQSKVPGRLSVGSSSWVGASCNLRAAGGTISIGRDCLIAQHVSLIASNHRIVLGETYLHLGWDETRTGVTIGHNVWIGCGVTVLPGITIGDHAIIGAGSVVTKSVPAGMIWAGNPARELRAVAK